MNFTKILPYGPDAYAYWISGIYKIVSYRPGEYHAYYIPEHFNNWGNCTEPAPSLNINGCRAWESLKAAKDSCERHALKHTPSQYTVRRAAEIKAALIIQAEQHQEAA